MKKLINSRLLFLAVCALAAACSSGSSGDDSGWAIKAQYEPGEITELCSQAVNAADAALLAIAGVPAEQRTIDNTLLALEYALADFSDRTLPLSFMGYVDSTYADEAMECEARAASYNVSVFTRDELYQAIKDQTPADEPQARLLLKTKQAFEQNGLQLGADKAAQVGELKSQLSTVESQFSANLNNARLTIEFSAADLSGVSEDVLGQLERTASGSYIVSTDYPEYGPVMQSASNSETRRQLLSAYLNRAADTNTPLLEQAILLREQIAALLGFASWADYRTAYRLAGSAANVFSFLAQLRDPLVQRERADLADLLAFKQSLDPSAGSLDQWDLPYLSYQLKKRTFTLDDDQVRQYFPIDQVISGMFSICEQLFGITIEEAGAERWAPDVTSYRIRNKADGTAIGYFYFDLFPREGKYSHFATAPLTNTRLMDGERKLPVCAVLGNFSPPQEDVPALLNHEEVETLFHEFGHALHMTLSTAPYASLSGFNAAWDFVETPSQAMQRWVWVPEVLNMVSARYDKREEKLPPEMMASIIAAKDFLLGYGYSRQLEYTYMDLEYHTATGPVDVTAVANRLYREFVGIDPIPGAHDPASFGHLMGGYDAGYYSYLWSEVYAASVFARFEAEGILNSTVGQSYREQVLEQGNMQDGTVLIRAFLGHDPTPDAFFSSLGIN